MVSNLEEKKNDTDPFTANEAGPDYINFDCNSSTAPWTDNSVISIKQNTQSTYALALQRIVYCLSDIEIGTTITVEQFVDGFYGSETEAAVETYQSTRGLLVDGIVGEQTWDSLQTELMGSIIVDPEYYYYSVGSSVPECYSVVQFYQLEHAARWGVL